MKNVIILSCSTGQGHNSCAEALKEYFEKENIRCEIVDGLDFISPRFARFMSWGHSFMYKHIPGLFGWGYRFNERHLGLLKKGSPIFKLLVSGQERMRKYLIDGGYDTVICTHVFPALALTCLLEKEALPVRTAFIATDYTCYPGVESIGLQRYFIPCSSLLGDFKSRVRFPERVAVTGIPVKDEFWTRRDKAEAKAALNLGPDNKHLLLMGGSMGCGPIVKLLRRITSEIPSNVEVTVICGTNKRLRRKLLRKYDGDRLIHIVGYTDDVATYMDSADLYLTKPGGISVTEAAAKRLPMVYVNAVSGCEKYNMDLFVGMGSAITDVSIDKLAERCIELLTSDKLLQKMHKALEDHGQPNGAELIYQELSKGSLT